MLYNRHFVWLSGLNSLVECSSKDRGLPVVFLQREVRGHLFLNGKLDFDQIVVQIFLAAQTYLATNSVDTVGVFFNPCPQRIIGLANLVGIAMVECAGQ